jgi:diguanylate cyclase (GGDEF)-like protein
MIRLHGSILRGLHAAGESVRLLAPDAQANAAPYDPGRWYEVSELERLIRRFQRYSDPSAVLERVGEELMRAWYRDGPGRQLAPGALDFLRFQAGSSGYRSVVQGPSAALGDFILAQLDEAAGTALLRSTTIFDPHLELGILRGALDAAGDLLYADVEMAPDREHYAVRFVTPAIADTVSWMPGATAQTWALRYRVLRLEQRERFWTGINDTLNEAFRNMQREATVDPLTGVCSSTEFMRRLQVEHARAQRNGRPLSLLSIHIEGFETVNDHFGHGAGDAVLAAFGRACRSLVRLPDVAGRLCGEEFAVVLGDCSLECAHAVGKRLAEAARAVGVPYGGEEIEVSLSIGVAALQAGQTAQGLVEAAGEELRKTRGQA